MNASPELHIHRSIYNYLLLVMPDALVVHVPNQIDVSGRLAQRAVAKNVSMGMVPGFPDLMVLAGGDVAPMFFEVKSPKGRVSDNQVETMRRLVALGYRCAVVRSIEDVQAKLREWGVTTRVSSGVVEIRGAIE